MAHPSKQFDGRLVAEAASEASAARPNPRSNPHRGAAPLCAWLVAATAMVTAGCESTPPVNAGAARPATATTTTGGSATMAHSRLLEAFNGCQEAAFLAAYAPLFTFASSNTRQVLTTREELQRYLATGCANRPNPMATLVQQTTRVSGNITVFAGQYRFRLPAGNPGGPTVEVLQNFTAVFERMGDRWLVLAHHLSVAP